MPHAAMAGCLGEFIINWGSVGAGLETLRMVYPEFGSSIHSLYSPRFCSGSGWFTSSVALAMQDPIVSRKLRERHLRCASWSSAAELLHAVYRIYVPLCTK